MILTKQKTRINFSLLSILTFSSQLCPIKNQPCLLTLSLQTKFLRLPHSINISNACLPLTLSVLMLVNCPTFLLFRIVRSNFSFSD